MNFHRTAEPARGRYLRYLVVALAASGCFPVAQGQSAYPERTVTLVVPFPPGGGTDVIARNLANRLTQKWGQTVIVDNRAGAAGIIGADAVARAKPDGYTLLIGNVGTQAINPSLYTKLPYNSETAFTPIAMIAELPIVLLTNSNFQAKSVQELVAMAKARPEKITYASSGAGNSTHLAAEFFQAATGVKLLHVPYKGGSAGTSDLLGGHVDLQFTSVLETSSAVKAGQLRALAVTSAQRTAALPDVPTLAESGVRGAESGSWVALLGPTGLAPDVVARLSADVQSVMATPEVKQALVAQGATALGAGPDALRKMIADDTRRYGDVIRRLGLKAAN